MNTETTTNEYNQQVLTLTNDHGDKISITKEPSKHVAVLTVNGNPVFIDDKDADAIRQFLFNL